MDERRQLPRWEIKKDAKVWIPLTQGFNHGVVEDLHLKGMCISFNKRIPHQKIIRLSFSIGENYDFIKVEAEIPWRMENQEKNIYGLSFTNIADESRDKIYQYINANCYDQFKDKWWA